MVYSDKSQLEPQHTGEIISLGLETYPTLFHYDLQSALNESKNASGKGALILVAITNLSMIISGYGHESTQKVLGDLQQHIKAMVSEHDTVMRLQKDQIGIILHRAGKDEARGIAERIQHLFQNFGYSSNYGALHFVTNIACVFLNESCLCPESLLNFGYVALHKQQQPYGILYRNFEISPLESAQSRQEMGLANYLLRGINENRLRMAYQPVIESRTGKIAHYEALLRITSDDGTISSAGALIPIAERMGLIGTIDDLVMRKTIEEVSTYPDVKLAFNVSNVTTENTQWLDDFRALLSGRPEIASRIMVEITETAIHRDLARTAYFVAAIQATGAQVALDDFGSGYTSFRQLKALSVDVVKIDGAFIRDLADNPDNRFFVRTLMDFIKGFGLRAVAEYVESGEIAKILMEMGVDYMQGYYFGKPENHRSWRKES